MLALALVLGALGLLVFVAIVVDGYRRKSRQIDSDINSILGPDDKGHCNREAS